jgi:cytochrome c553
MMLSMYGKFRLANLTAAIIFSTLVFTGQVLAADDIAQGELLADTCKGCHAVDSYTNVYPTYHVPRLAGQSAGYLATALTLYRDGDRDHPTMTAQSASFSDQEIQDIAAYLAAAGGQLDAARKSSGEAPAAAAVCAACHGAAGVSLIPANPSLAGQHLDYMEQAIKQYESGARKGPNAIAMRAQLGTVSDDDLAAILEFYAAQEGLSSLSMD